MIQATCSAGLLTPSSPYFQSNTTKGPRKAKLLRAALHLPAPLPALCCPSLPRYKNLQRVRASLQQRGLLGEGKQTNRSFQNTARPAFVSIWISQSEELNMRLHPGSGQATTNAARRRLFRYSRYFPTASTQYLLDHLQQRRSKHCLHVAASRFMQISPTCCDHLTLGEKRTPSCPVGCYHE